MTIGQFRPVVVVAIRPLALPWLSSTLEPPHAAREILSACHWSRSPKQPSLVSTKTGKSLHCALQSRKNMGVPNIIWRWIGVPNQRKIPAGPSGEGGETCQSSRYPSKRQGKRSSLHIPTAGGFGKKMVPTKSSKIRAFEYWNPWFWGSTILRTTPVEHLLLKTENLNQLVCLKVIKIWDHQLVNNHSAFMSSYEHPINHNLESFMCAHQNLPVTRDFRRSSRDPRRSGESKGPGPTNSEGAGIGCATLAPRCVERAATKGGWEPFRWYSYYDNGAINSYSCKVSLSDVYMYICIYVYIYIIIYYILCIYVYIYIYIYICTDTIYVYITCDHGDIMVL